MSPILVVHFTNYSLTISKKCLYTICQLVLYKQLYVLFSIHNKRSMKSDKLGLTVSLGNRSLETVQSYQWHGGMADTAGPGLLLHISR